MNKILYLVALLISINSFSQGKIGAPGDIQPTGNYPIIDIKNVKGGIKPVNSITDRDNIPLNFRYSGMMVTDTVANKYYQLQDGIGNANWKERVNILDANGSLSSNRILDQNGHSFTIQNPDLNHFTQFGQTSKIDYYTDNTQLQISFVGENNFSMASYLKATHTQGYGYKRASINGDTGRLIIGYYPPFTLNSIARPLPPAPANLPDSTATITFSPATIDFYGKNINIPTIKYNQNVIYAQDLKVAGMTDLQVIQAGIDKAKEGDIVDLHKPGSIITYTIDGSIVMKNNVTLEGVSRDSTAVVRGTPILYTLTATYTTGTTITLNTVAGLRLGDKIILQPTVPSAYNKTSPYRFIQSISGNNVTVESPFGNSFDGTVTSWGIGTSVVRSWEMLTNVNLGDEATTYKAYHIKWDGNKAENTLTYAYNINNFTLLRSKYRSRFEGCTFVNMPNENIVGGNIDIVDCILDNLNGSAAHTSISKNLHAESELRMFIDRCYINNTNQTSNANSGHSEGVFTTSNSGGYYNVQNTFVNNSNGYPLIGNLYASLSSFDWGTHNINVHDNELSNLSGLVGIIGSSVTIRNVRVTKNKLFNVTKYDYSADIGNRDIVIDGNAVAPDSLTASFMFYNWLKTNRADIGTLYTNSINNSSTLSATNSIAVTGSGQGFIAPSDGSFYFNNRSKITSTVDGSIILSNSGVNSFDYLRLGGTTSSFPAIRRNGQSIDFILSDGSARADITAGASSLTKSQTFLGEFLGISFKNAAGSTTYGTLTGDANGMHLAGAPNVYMTGTGLSSIGAFSLGVSGAGTNVFGIDMTDANLTSGQTLLSLLGVGNATNNKGYMGYKYAGSGSTSNMLTWGFYGNDNLVNLPASGNLLVGTTTDVSSAILNISSTTKGALLPRMNRTQFAAITATQGNLAYGTLLDKFIYSNGTTVKVLDDSATIIAKYRQISDTAASGTSTATIGQLQKRIDSLSATLIKTGIAFFSGNGVTTTFDITLSSTPTWANAEATSTDAANITYRTPITGGIRIFYTVAPPSGSNNISITYMYK